tara:strand:- start:165 stop:950 length:786 start_codon:yes stop_codon:yes gene_type:complete
MQGSRTGGAGKVHADYNVNYLSKQVAYNGEATQIPVGSIVSLRTSNNGAALKAFLAMPTNAAHWDGIWAVVRGGFGTGSGETSGLVVQWAVVDLDTSATQLDAPVYVNQGAPGVPTLVAAAGAAVVGKVIRIGASATDIKNTVLLDPQSMRNAGNPAEIQDVGKDNTFADASLVIGSGGTCKLGGASGNRTLNEPLIAGQEVTFTAVNGLGHSVTVATGLNTAGNTILTLGAATDVVVLRAVAVGTNLRWRIVLNDGVALS